MAPSIKSVMYLAISVMIVGVLIPTALANIITGGMTLTDASVNSSVITMFTVLYPIMIVVGILIYYIPSKYYKKGGKKL